jgi:protease II
MIDLESSRTTTIFTDDDPTHYIDLGVTKDKKYLIIASNTKEDSEVWVLPRDVASNETVVTPTLLVSRQREVKAHIDHVRDFFVTITTDDKNAQDYRIASLSDTKFGKHSKSDWQDLLDPELFRDKELVITEFDCFEKFIALYVKIDGKPDVLIYDLEAKKSQ